jgi:hypothetical protein
MSVCRRRSFRFAAVLVIALGVCLPIAPLATSQVQAAAAVVARPVHRTTVNHGTLKNRHVRTARVARPAPGARRAVTAGPRKTTVHRTVTRGRRVAHARPHRRGGVGGHVRNSAGEPVANATVYIAVAGHAHARHGVNRHVRRAHQTVTDNAGHYVMRGVASGGHRVVASKSGMGKATRAVHVRGGALRAGLDLKLGGTHHKHPRHRHKK